MSIASDMFPVRVLVETVRHQHCLGCAHDGNPLVDTFAVVGGQTMLCQLVETVLSALGLPQLVQDSKGLIQIRGWKPISFETITDNPEELVSNLFREISTHITLKILAKRSPSEPNGLCLAELKQRLLKTAIEKQPQILTTVDGQEVKQILQQVIQGDEQCLAWGSREQSEAVNEWLEQMAAQHEESRKSPLCITRFSPLSELPRLERWFRSDPNPSRQKLLSYMNILNTSPYRRANNKVTYQQICNWFANQRRTAQRNSNVGGSGAGKKQQQLACDLSANPTTAAKQQQPMAMLPLNATGGPSQSPNHLPAPFSFLSPSSTTATFLNSLTSSMANSGMDRNHMQQKLTAALLSVGGIGTDDGHRQSILTEQRQKQSHQIPIAHGPPLDIRAKFESTGMDQESNIGCSSSGGGGMPTNHREGQQGAGGHQSDRMDGGSESPTGNDDMSDQSGTCDGIRDSMACSPEQLFMDIQQQQQQMDVLPPLPTHQFAAGAGMPQPPQQQQNQCLLSDDAALQRQRLDNGIGEEGDGGGQPQLDGCLSPQATFPPPPSTTASGIPVGLNLAHFLQPVVGHQPSSPSTSTHSAAPSAAMAAAAAAAAFSSLMPNAVTTQSQLQFINQLAMATQFQGLPTATTQASSKNSFSIPVSTPVKSTSSTNSLADIINKEEALSGMISIKSESGGFSSPSQNANQSNGGQNGANGQQQTRSRLMFDPLSELPILERWFEDNPHPGWLQIEQYTDYLNSMTYRQNYPPISTHNVKIWFKNRRAKTKRLQNNNESPIAAGDLGS